MFKILGVSFSSGTTNNGIAYDNIIFHAAHAANDSYTVGEKICRVKFPSSALASYSKQDLIDMIGKDLDFNGIPRLAQDRITYYGYVGISNIN